ncbi:MAG: hypothetical protein ACI388_07915 [Methanobrevibacter sp.]|uniref:hypothetical protein n=1 Tax=Methanobrevibacter sp. TaxID=66852 RepID=UPI002A5EDB4B|nr:hypothetical protein [Turicibacter sp.]
MEIKKIGLILIIICVIIMGATFIYTNQNTTNNSSAHVNNTTNITKNATLNNTNVTEEPVKEDSSSHESSSSDSKSYVEKWDESQQTDGDWAYTHDQPVKTGDDGKEYKRVYDEDSGKSSWQSMDASDYED